MEKIYARLDAEVIKSKYFERIIGGVISKLTGCEAMLAGPMATKLGVDFASQSENLKQGKKTFIRAYMESLIDTIDARVDKFIIDHNNMYRIDEDKIHLANEAATEDVFSNDEADDMGSTLSDMLEEMLDKKLNDVKDVAKLVIRMEKEKQDNDKDALLDENDEIEEENQEEGTDDQEDAFGGDDDSKPADGDEGGNPFDANSDEENAGSGDSEGSENSDNPFGGNTDGSSGEEDTSNGSDNPFESSDEGQPAESNGNDNPFAEGESSDGNGDQSEGGSGNPFESITDISSIVIGGRQPFYSLRRGDLSNFVASQTRLVFEEPMRKAFDEFGQESVEFKTLTNQLQHTNKAALESVIAVASICPLLGFKVDINKVRNWDLYLED